MQRTTLTNYLYRAVYIFLDNNIAGRKGTDKTAAYLERFLQVRIIDYRSEDMSLQPDDLDEYALEEALNNPINVGDWRKQYGFRRIQPEQRARGRL